MDHLPGDFEDNQDDEKGQHPRREDAPGGVMKSHQRQQPLGQGRERPGQQRAEEESEERETGPHRPLLITGGGHQSQTKKSENPNHAGRLAGWTEKSTLNFSL